MLTFMNSKLTKMAGKDKQNTFSKKVNPMKYPVHIYIYLSIYLCIYIYLYIHIYIYVYINICDEYHIYIIYIIYIIYFVYIYFYIYIYTYIFMHIYICILARTRNLLFVYFTGVSHQTMKFIITEKTSNLIKGIFSHNLLWN